MKFIDIKGKGSCTNENPESYRVPERCTFHVLHLVLTNTKPAA